MTVFGRNEVVEWKEFEGASVCQLTECIEMIEEVVVQSVRHCLTLLTRRYAEEGRSVSTAEQAGAGQALCWVGPGAGASLSLSSL